MALQFHPLPPEVFPEAARPYIVRHNLELRDLFGLEGVIRQPVTSRRSDATITRRSEVQVAVSRITPSVASVVSGVSTVVGTPALILGTVNTVGSTTTAVSVNSALALFGTGLPSGLSASAIVGTSAYAARADHIHAGFDATVPAALGSSAATGSVGFAARRDHVHLYPPILGSTANASTLTLTDDGTDQRLTGSLGSIYYTPASGGGHGFDTNATTAPSVVGSVYIRVGAGARTGLRPVIFSGDLSSATLQVWDASMSAFSGVLTGATLVAYDVSNFSITPSATSNDLNKLYGVRVASGNFQINNSTGGWAEVATAYFQGVQRSLFSPEIDVQATIIVEPPTAASLKTDDATATDQIGILIRQQTVQATATNRVGLDIEAQNSGTNRFSIRTATDKCLFGGEAEIDGDLNHDGTNVGLYGIAPVAQYATTGTVTGYTGGGGTALTHSDTFTGNTGATAYTIGDIVRALKLMGAMLA